MRRDTSQCASQVELLADVVQTLADELKVLRAAVDELREELQWANHNVAADTRGDPRWLCGRRIQSFAVDPTSRDFAVNTVDDETVEQLRSELNVNQAPTGRQGELFR